MFESGVYILRVCYSWYYKSRVMGDVPNNISRRNVAKDRSSDGPMLGRWVEPG